MSVQIDISLWHGSPPLGLCLHCEALRSRSDTPQSVGLLWMSDRPVAETSSWQHTTLTRDFKPQAQQAMGRKSTP